MFSVNYENYSSTLICSSIQTSSNIVPKLLSHIMSYKYCQFIIYDGFCCTLKKFNKRMKFTFKSCNLLWMELVEVSWISS